MPAAAYHPKSAGLTTGELASQLGLELKGDTTLTLSDVQPLHEATAADLSFLDNEKYKTAASQTKAGAVILSATHAEVLPAGVTALISQEPYADYARALALFYPPQAGQGIHPTAVIADSATIADGVSIGAHSVVGAGCTIGAGSQIGSNVTLQCCQIGRGVIIHPGVRIGQDGFGFAPSAKEGVVKVPQVGGVVIEDGVEIGANTTIDRGALGDTVIGAGTKIDNQVQIAHNVQIGKMCMIVAQAGIAGSTKLGNGVVVGGQVGVAGHLEIADRIQIAGRSGVTKSFNDVGQILGGFPAVPIAQWRKLQALLSRMVKKS